MTNLKIACAAGALLLASAAAAAAPVSTARAVPLPGSGGAWVYDGRLPPSCNDRDVRVRHFAGDGHPGAHADHAHLGHGHKWSKRNFKGYPTKPPCYVRRAGDPRLSPSSSIQSMPPTAGQTPAIRNALSGDLS